MKLSIILIATFSLGQILIAEDKVDFQDTFKLTEPVNNYSLFDLPLRPLAGSPDALFKGDAIDCITTIADGSGPRTIVGPLCQEMINVLRSGKTLKKVNVAQKSRVIGVISLISGRVVLIREQDDLLIIQVGRTAGSLAKSDFPALKGISAKILK